ncbi:SIMPL domain-containing protein [bacterium]|nr:SIMPL domain-containing protein [bacterium]
MLKPGLILTAALMAGCATPTVNSPHTITVFGTAVAEVPPDKFSMSLNISSRRPVSDRALADTEAKLATARQLLGKFKVPDSDYVFGGTQVELEDLDEASKGKKPREFLANSSIEVTLYDAEQRDQLIRGLINQHVGEISGVSNSLKDPIAHRNEARLAAVRQARLKAKAMAQELGQSLGKASALEENAESDSLQLQPQRLCSLK